MRTAIRPHRPAPGGQRGAALIVGLVLLLVLTILGVSGMSRSALELRMAGNSQAQNLAFQAAETGIDVALSGPVDTAAPVSYDNVSFAQTADGDTTVEYSATITCVGATRVPDGAYSDNISAQAIHFEATATGTHLARNAVTRITQGVYIIAPSSSNPNFNPAASPGDC